jgi:beta-galactosidase GanA
VAYDPTAGFPDLATIRVEVGVPATVLADEQLEAIAGSEQDNMHAAYEWTDSDLPDRLYQVFLRSVARTIAARGLPLGMVGTDSEYGVARLTTRDSEIVRLGGQYRKRTFA